MSKIDAAIKQILYSIPDAGYKPYEPMSAHTSFGIGGPARVMFFPESTEALAKLLGALAEQDVHPLVIGNGTNLLVDDRPLDIAVIKTTGVNYIERTGEYELTAGAGAPVKQISVKACECGLSGLEFAYGIPGTLGGAVTMNAGAYGGEIGGVVFSTTAYSPASGVALYDNDEHFFSYRSSRFSGHDLTVLSSVIRLQKEDAKAIKALMDGYEARRNESQPLDLPSAGSVFKRPKQGYSAALIEEAGLKGYRVGGAQVSDKHSGFIVNNGGAAFSDVVAVIEHVRETVFKRTGIELETEVRIIQNSECRMQNAE